MSGNSSKGENRPITPVFDEEFTKIGPFEVDIYDAVTAVHLLKSTEDHVVLAALCNLDSYLAKDEVSHLMFLIQYDFLKNLIHLMQRQPVVIRMVLKIIARIIKVDKGLRRMQTPQYVQIISNALVMSQDQIVTEYATYVLGIICKTYQTKRMLCRADLIEKLFTSIVTTMDPDVKSNCLQVLLRLVSYSPASYFIAQCPEFRIRILNYLLKGPFPKLRPIIMCIMECVSSWGQESIQAELYESNTVTFMFDVLLEADWSEMHNRVLQTINNCMSHYSCQCNSVTSKEFLKFFNFAKTASPEHALGCVTLIAEFAKADETRQAMFDLGIHEELVHFYKVDCDLLRVKISEAIGYLSMSCHIADAMATDNYFKELAKTMSLKYLPWIPYRQASILPLHSFLMTTPELSAKFYKNNVLKQLRIALEEREQLDKHYISMVIDMYQCLFSTQSARSYLINQDVYAIFFQLLQEDNIELSQKVLNIIDQTLVSEEYRKWFMELSGIGIIGNMLSDSSPMVEDALSFIKICTKYEDLARCFLFAQIIPVLNKWGDKDIKYKVICNSIVADLYRSDLSCKFNETETLDVNDQIKNGFCAYVGPRPIIFPFNEVTQLKKLKNSCTMIVVNICGKKHEKKLVSTASLDSLFRKKEFAARGSDSSLHKPKVIYKYKISLPDKEKEVFDCYLKTYIYRLQPLIDQEYLMIRKIGVLARFVNWRLHGHDNFTTHQYLTHINELKRKLQSNYIPLGYIRVGGMVERAILFKVLADRFDIPCTLRRTSDDFAWNEIPLIPNVDKSIFNKFDEFPVLRFHVVDLMENVGALMPVGKMAAYLYCQEVDIEERKKIMAFFPVDEDMPLMNEDD